GQQRSVPLLMSLLEDGDTLIRTSAIDSLLRCFDTAPLKRLGQMMKDDPDADVRSRARIAFKALTLDKFF
ncbi:MAG TPA: HEAT repeat domain-containing protein, partial [Verrucomicrobiae bacterium]|nr:HEAT repeat domain-containing protein [Verrucomicrobiae bacterium]